MSVTWDQTRLAPNMDVLGPNGEQIGQVKEVRDRDFLLDRMMKRDVYVPFSAVREIAGSTVTLKVRADEIDDLGWDKAPMFGGTEESDTTVGPAEEVTGIGDPTERNAWSPAADAYDLGALDTEDARLATEGIDDGEQPLPREPESGPRKYAIDKTDETERLRDLQA